MPLNITPNTNLNTILFGAAVTLLTIGTATLTNGQAGYEHLLDGTFEILFGLVVTWFWHAYPD